MDKTTLEKLNYFLDDGAYVIAKILMLLPELKRKGITLDEQIKELKQPVEVQEIRLKLFSDEPREQGMWEELEAGNLE